jgi:transcriptional regulator with XRE-family HTH domain
VCGRLRKARESLDLTQLVVAGVLKISRDKLANYEYLRAPVKWSVGYSFCLNFGMSLGWLATGKGEMRDEFELPMLLSMVVDVPESTSFASAYENFVLPEIRRAFKIMKPGDDAKKGRQKLKETFDFWSENVPDSEMQNFSEVIWRIGERLRADVVRAGFGAFLLSRHAEESQRFKKMLESIDS